MRFTSRKFVLGVLLLLGVFTLAFLGKVEAPEAMKYGAAVYAAYAVSNSVAKFGE